MSELPPSTAPRPKRSASRRSRKAMANRRRGRRGQRVQRPHRWRRRAVIGLGSLVAIIILLIGGGYVYTRWRLGQIAHENVNGLTAVNGNQPFDVLLVGSDSRQFAGSADVGGS